MPTIIPRRSVAQILAALTPVALIIATFFLWPCWNSDDEPAVAATVASDQPIRAYAAEPDADNGRVTLSQGKLTAMAIEVQPAVRGKLTTTRCVPGRIAYNDNRHVQLRAPADGILTQVLVKPGDQVAAGQVLAWLNSSEVGTARADVLQRKAEETFARQVETRASTVQQNVSALSTALKTGPAFEAVQRQFADRVLLNYREKLFGAYSRFLLADAMIRNAKLLQQSGSLAGKTLLQRQEEQQSAQAALESASEQAEQEVWRQHRLAVATAQDATRRLEIAREHLASLLLSQRAIAEIGGSQPEDRALGASDDNLSSLSRVPIRAPFEGTIEERSFSASERVRASDSLFVLADIDQLWVTAELRENEWSAVSLQPGQKITVTVPALEDRSVEAILYYIGRRVSKTNNAIPMVATIENADRLLRPGLFVHAEVPIQTAPDALTIPEEALQQHGGRPFVFIREAENVFQRIDVQTGQTGQYRVAMGLPTAPVDGGTGDGPATLPVCPHGRHHSHLHRVAIVAGLAEGQQVVTRGGFLLKSELLLESEED